MFVPFLDLTQLLKKKEVEGIWPNSFHISYWLYCSSCQCMKITIQKCRMPSQITCFFSFCFEILFWIVSRTLIVYGNYKKCIKKSKKRAYKTIVAYRYFYSLAFTIIKPSYFAKVETYSLFKLSYPGNAGIRSIFFKELFKM